MESPQETTPSLNRQGCERQQTRLVFIQQGPGLGRTAMVHAGLVWHVRGMMGFRAGPDGGTGTGEPCVRQSGRDPGPGIRNRARREGKRQIDLTVDRAACRLQSGGRPQAHRMEKGPRPEKRGERSVVPFYDRAGSPPDRIGMQIRPGGMVGASPPILHLYRGPARDCLKPSLWILCPIHPHPSGSLHFGRTGFCSRAEIGRADGFH